MRGAHAAVARARGARSGHTSAPTALDTHAKRAHLAARKEGLNRGVLIVLDGPVGGRVAVLRRGHAESDGGGARAGLQRRSGRRARVAHDDGAAEWARALPSCRRGWRWRRTLSFALTASGYAASRAFTTATDTLNLAAMWSVMRLVPCTWHMASRGVAERRGGRRVWEMLYARGTQGRGGGPFSSP
jgi:hypothetical protein